MNNRLFRGNDDKRKTKGLFTALQQSENGNRFNYFKQRSAN